MRKRTAKWIIGLLLTLAMLLPVAPMRGIAAPTMKTDAEFFGKLNLTTAGMEAVKTAVDAGNYSTAKAALLTYYKNKFASYETTTGGIGGYFGTLAMVDTFAYLETPLSHKTISYNDGAYMQYSFGVVNNTSGCYVLSVLKKAAYSVEICSREYATASMRPVLKCYNSAGALLASVNPTADTSVKYGSKATNYGDLTTLYAQHDATTSLPYAANSQRAYLKFTVPSGTAKTELVVYTKIKGGSSASHSLDLWQFEAQGKNWTEADLTWDWLVSNNAIGHYSYDGVAGGFDRQDEIGTSPNNWIDMHCRLHSVYGIFATAPDPDTSTAEKESTLTRGRICSLTLSMMQM